MIHTSYHRLILPLMSTMFLSACQQDPGATNASAPPKYELADFPVAQDGFTVHPLLKLTRSGHPTLELGYAQVAQGIVLPEENGTVSLPVDDIGIMLSGEQIALIDGQQVPIRERQLIHVMPGIPQAATYTKATSMIYTFFGDNVSKGDVERPVMDAPATDKVMVRKIDDLAAQQSIFPLLKTSEFETATLEIGYASVSAGTVSPSQGSVGLPAYDIEVILKGRIETVIDGKPITLMPGDIIQMQPQVSQIARFVEDSELLYIFYGAPVTIPESANQSE